MLREVIPNLWVASYPKPAMIHETGASAVICTVKKGLPEEVKELLEFSSEYAIPDGKRFRADLFELALEDLMWWHNVGNRKVIVNCHAGRNRSATLIALYLIRRGWSPEEAIARIREVRPRAIANPVFEAALLAGGLG